MSVKIQRTLDGTYHLMVQSGDFILTKADLAVIAAQAVTDGIVDGSSSDADDTETLTKSRRFFTRMRSPHGRLVGGDYYRAGLYIESGLALVIAALTWRNEA